MVLHLARHGETTEPGKFLGRHDPPLNEMGRQQSADLAARIADAGIQRIVSSRLTRSAETARIVAAHLNLGVETDPRWNEIDHGGWDGLTWAEIETRWPDQARRKLQDWWAVTPPNGEPAADFFARVREAFDELCASAATTLLVGHVSVNALVYDWTQGRGDTAQRVLEFQQSCGSSIQLTV